VGSGDFQRAISHKIGRNPSIYFNYGFDTEMYQYHDLHYVILYERKTVVIADGIMGGGGCNLGLPIVTVVMALFYTAGVMKLEQTGIKMNAQGLTNQLVCWDMNGEQRETASCYW
jgi:hypothetical protein